MKLFLFILLNSIVINKVNSQLYNDIDIKIEVGAKRKIIKVDVECADTAMVKNITERFSNYVFSKECPPKGNYLVRVRYVVSKDSSIADVKCLTNVGYGLEAEAIRAIRGPIRWAPAPQGGWQIREFRR